MIFLWFDGVKETWMWNEQDWSICCMDLSSVGASKSVKTNRHLTTRTWSLVAWWIGFLEFFYQEKSEGRQNDQPLSSDMRNTGSLILRSSGPHYQGCQNVSPSHHSYMISFSGWDGVDAKGTRCHVGQSISRVPRAVTMINPPLLTGHMEPTIIGTLKGERSSGSSSDQGQWVSTIKRVFPLHSDQRTVEDVGNRKVLTLTTSRGFYDSLTLANTHVARANVVLNNMYTSLTRLSAGWYLTLVWLSDGNMKWTRCHWSKYRWSSHEHRKLSKWPIPLSSSTWSFVDLIYLMKVTWKRSKYLLSSNTASETQAPSCGLSDPPAPVSAFTWRDVVQHTPDRLDSLEFGGILEFDM